MNRECYADDRDDVIDMERLECEMVPLEQE